MYEKVLKNMMFKRGAGEKVRAVSQEVEPKADLKKKKR